MRKFIALIILLSLAVFEEANAKFVQEVELRDGTILVGYVYRQQPGKFMVFFTEQARKDPKAKYMQHEKNYTLQWKDVKAIRRAAESDAQWCDDKVTLKDGTVHVGQITEQDLGESLTIRLKDNWKKVKVNSSNIKTMEKVASNMDKDLWIDRQYTNRLKLTDNSIREGLITLQYHGEKMADCYVELLHGSGYKERIFLPDIKEYIIQLQ